MRQGLRLLEVRSSGASASESFLRSLSRAGFARVSFRIAPLCARLQTPFPSTSSGLRLTGFASPCSPDRERHFTW